MLVMMGLAVGIDYALFVVSALPRGAGKGTFDKLEAITAAAGSTASRAVFSRVTVVLALVGMFLIPSTIFRSLAVGAILVVLVSVTAALRCSRPCSACSATARCAPASVRAPTERGRLLDAHCARGYAPARGEPVASVALLVAAAAPVRGHQHRLRGRLHAPRQLRVRAASSSSTRSSGTGRRRRRSSSTATSPRPRYRPASSGSRRALPPTKPSAGPSSRSTTSAISRLRRCCSPETMPRARRSRAWRRSATTTSRRPSPAYRPTCSRAETPPRTSTSSASPTSTCRS